MSRKTQFGTIIWHDLLTHTAAQVKDFYAELLGWDYQIEHATDCAWTSGEADYLLIMAQEEAHGGIVSVAQAQPAYWLGYVCVEQVDTVMQKAIHLGASIHREPFDVPGVGRNAVIRDPLGALIGLTTPTHLYPPPKGTFLMDVLVTLDIDFAKQFYTKLFGWQAKDIESDRRGQYSLFKTADATRPVGTVLRSPAHFSPAVWVPMMATTDRQAALTRALSLGANTIDDIPDTAPDIILTDPTGARFGLSAIGS